MSSLLAVIASVAPTVAAVATATPMPSPTATATVAAHASSISDYINALAAKVSQTDLLVAAGIVVTGLQFLLNRFKFLRDAEDKAKEVINYLISFVLPFATLAASSFASGQNTLKLAPVVYLIGQFLYMVLSQFKSRELNPQPEPPGVATTQF